MLIGGDVQSFTLSLQRVLREQEGKFSGMLREVELGGGRQKTFYVYESTLFEGEEVKIYIHL